MDLDQQLAEFKAEFARSAPAGRAALYEAKIEELRARCRRNGRQLSPSGSAFVSPPSARLLVPCFQTAQPEEDDS